MLIFINFLGVFPFWSKFEVAENFFCQQGLALGGFSSRIYNLSRKMFSKHIIISTHYWKVRLVRSRQLSLVKFLVFVVKICQFKIARKNRMRLAATARASYDFECNFKLTNFDNKYQKFFKFQSV